MFSHLHVKQYNEFFVKVVFGVVKWRGEEYRSGSFVFLTPGVFKFKSGAAPVFKSHSRKEDKVSCC